MKMIVNALAVLMLFRVSLVATPPAAAPSAESLGVERAADGTSAERAPKATTNGATKAPADAQKPTAPKRALVKPAAKPRAAEQPVAPQNATRKRAAPKSSTADATDNDTSAEADAPSETPDGLDPIAAAERVATLDGIEVAYTAAEALQGRRTRARSELLLRGLDATMATEERLGYGRQVLEPGRYELAVEGNGSDGFELVFRESEMDEADATDESDESDETEEPSDAEMEDAESDGDDDDTAGDETAGDDAVDEDGDDTRADDAPAPALLRARLRITDPAPARAGAPVALDRRIAIELAPRARGRKLRLTVRSSTLVAVADLRRLDVEAAQAAPATEPAPAPAGAPGRTARKRGGADEADPAPPRAAARKTRARGGAAATPRTPAVD